MRIGSFVRRGISFSRHATRSYDEDLKWTPSGDFTEDSSRNGADMELVELFEIDGDTEVREAVEAVFGSDSDSAKGEIDQDPYWSTKLVDRTPSKVDNQNEETYEGHKTTQGELQMPQGPQLSHQELQPPFKPRYTKEEKQRRFMKELFRISTNHLNTTGHNNDDESIVSSAVGSVSSVPPLTALERFLQIFSCAPTSTGTVPSRCLIKLQGRAATSENLLATTESRKGKDDDSLDQALAGLPLPSSEPSPCNQARVTNVAIASPMTVPDEAMMEVDEIIEGEAGSAVSVKYSVRHVTSLHYDQETS